MLPMGQPPPWLWDLPLEKLLGSGRAIRREVG